MKPSREEVLKVAGDPVEYVLKLWLDAAPLYTEDQLLVMYEAGAASERAVSDKLLEAVNRLLCNPSESNKEFARDARDESMRNGIAAATKP